MNLQRYDMEAMSYSGAWVKEIPSEDGEWVKADEAIAEVDRLLAMIQELKCCGNCKWGLDLYEANCLGCREPELKNWEAK